MLLRWPGVAKCAGVPLKQSVLCSKQASRLAGTVIPCGGVLDGPICGRDALASPFIRLVRIGSGDSVFRQFRTFHRTVRSKRRGRQHGWGCSDSRRIDHVVPGGCTKVTQSFSRRNPPRISGARNRVGGVQRCSFGGVSLSTLLLFAPLVDQNDGRLDKKGDHVTRRVRIFEATVCKRSGLCWTS